MQTMNFSPPSEEQKIGLCLSGGGLRAIAHLGVIQVIEEYNIPIHEVSGTSAGAIVGAFFNKGFKAKEMLEIVQSNQLFSRKDFNIFKGGSVFSPQMLTDLFNKYLVTDSFESLQRPLFVATTNLNTASTQIFSSGTLFDKLQATAAVPFVFPTVTIEGNLHCDGGVLNNLPVETLKPKNQFIIASFVNALSPLEPGPSLHNMQYAERLFHMVLANPVYQKQSSCDVFINPPDMTSFSIFNSKDAQNLFDMGYKYALDALSNFKP